MKLDDILSNQPLYEGKSGLKYRMTPGEKKNLRDAENKVKAAPDDDDVGRSADAVHSKIHNKYTKRRAMMKHRGHDVNSAKQKKLDKQTKKEMQQGM